MSSLSLTSESENSPFIPQEKVDERETCTCHLTPRQDRSRRICQTLFISFNCVFAFLNAVLLFTNLKHANPPGCPEQYGRYEPDGIPRATEEKTWHLPIGVRSPYTSLDPTIADAAWEKIVIGTEQGWVNISQEKVNDMGQDSIQFDDGSGYFFGLDVFHQLHCLNYIRKKTLLYAPVYQNQPGEEDIPMKYHIPHCLDSIRLSLQCHADMSVIPQRWAPGWIEPWAIWTNHHQCRNFEHVRDWARQNGLHSPGQLTHPELGAVRNGKVNVSALPIYNEEHDIEVEVTLS
ncbi:hypothetical protein J7T55_005840 [Diaporthe amygdali]|uniref:uncharacterized protein n=1 Tax=Phomopsis amygdali TaxID=1214568 RepID=UPI0022FEDD3E|nr:uncharacterized protein J7T55_005840 [Diaporthe amygdali]KAJ0124502.1 hypothetical protein J7T55_005840 [Diaporthe amygdali]